MGSAVSPTVNQDYEFSTVTVKIKDVKAKSANGKPVEFKGRVKQYKAYDAMLAGVGGDAVVLNIVNGVLENRAKGKAASIIRLLPEDGNLEDAVKNAQTALEEFVYSERGVGAKKRLENLEQLKADIKAGKIKMSELSDEEAESLILGL